MDNPYAYRDAQNNFLPEDVPYKIEETSLGTWKSFMYEDKTTYHEFVAHGTCLGLPWIHYTAGICPETGRRKTAKGMVAVGRIAMGGIAIGQTAVGFVAVGQASAGLVLGIGQATLGCAALGQFAVGAVVACGQFAAGYSAVGQFAVGVMAWGMATLTWPL